MAELNVARVEQVFRDANFVHSIGMELVEFGLGWCHTLIRVSPSLLQQHGFVHAGVLMTLADHTCGTAAASTIPADKDVITIENKVTFLRPGAGDVLYCNARVLRTGKTLVFTEAEIFVDRNHERVLVTKASSTLSVIPLHTRS